MPALAPTQPTGIAQKSAEKPARRRNVDRSAATRKVILEATICCLHKQGFGAVTNHTVADLAGVFHGGHTTVNGVSIDYGEFFVPSVIVFSLTISRQALLVATVEYAYEKLRQTREGLVNEREPGLPRYRALIDVSWTTAQMPEDIACNEIRMGSRSDPEIAAAITPIMIKVGDDFARYIGRVARQAGLETDDELKGLTATTAMVVRAMAVNLFTYPRTSLIDVALNSLKLSRERLIARQLGEAAAESGYE